MRANLRGVLVGAICGGLAALIFVVGGCGSSSAGLPFRQVDRTGKPGIEVLFLKDPKAINTFNFLSPAGDKFALDTSTSSSVQIEALRVLTAFSALSCFTSQNSGNFKPFNKVCPAITLTGGKAPANFGTWVTNTVVPEFEGTFLPDVIRLDTDRTFADRGELRYAFDIGSGGTPLVCRPDSPRTYCGGRRFGEDDMRFNYSQMFLGTTGSLAVALATVQDDGVTTASTITNMFPYLEVPGL